MSALWFSYHMKYIDDDDEDDVKGARKKRNPSDFIFLNLRVGIPIIPRGVRTKNGISLSPQPHA